MTPQEMVDAAAAATLCRRSRTELLSAVRRIDSGQMDARTREHIEEAHDLAARALDIVIPAAER